MKLRLPRLLRTAVISAVASRKYIKSVISIGTFTAGSSAALFAFLSCIGLQSVEAQTLSVFILTGQSNAQGAVKDYPLTSDQLKEYSSSDVMFWYRNVTSYATDPSTFVESSSWGQVAPQVPTYNGNLCMGPEYGFSYMMEKKGWMISDNSDVAVIKASLNGGGDQYWVKGSVGYTNILTAVKDSLTGLDRNTYSTVNLAGLLYLQGESGVTDGRYASLITNLQADLTAAGYTGVVVTIDQANVIGQPSNNNGSSSYQNYVQNNPTTSKWVITSDLKQHSTDNGLHFSGAAQLTIGARYAYSMALLKGLNVGFVRGQENAALDTAAAWWGGTAALNSLASNVIEWDLSSANITHTISATNGSTLQVGGIRIADTYLDNETTTIQGGHANTSTNAADGTTLSIGASGISVGGINVNQNGNFQYSRNLVLASNLSLRGNQDWMLSGGSSLTVRGDSADTASIFNKSVISGTGNVSLKRLPNTSGFASFRINHADVAGGSRTWTLNDGVDLQLNKSVAWNNNSFVIVSNASASISDGGDGLGLSIGSLSLGNNSQLLIGGNSSGSLALTTGNLTIGTGSTLSMGISGLRHDSLIYSGANALTVDGLNFNFDYKGNLDDTMKIVVMENAGNLTNFTWNSKVSASLDSKLELVDGNLVLSFTGAGGVIWPDYSPSCSAMQATGGSNITWNARAASGVTSGQVVTRTNSVASGTNIQYYYANSGAYTGDVYGVLDDGLVYTWASGTGSGSSSGFGSNTLDGSVSIKVIGDYAGKTTQTMIGAVNATVNGNVYMEFGATNVTTAYASFGLGSITGVYNSQINGSLTLLVTNGTHNNNVVVGNVNNGARSIENGTYLTIQGGTFNAKIYGGGSIGTINQGTDVTIKGGTFNDEIFAGGSGGTITGGTNLTIMGGTFANGKGIYAGGSNGTIEGGTTVRLKDIDNNNSFAAFTGVLSGGSQAGSLTGNRDLVLDHYTAPTVASNIQNFDSISLVNQSKTGMTLAKMQVAAGGISIERGSELIFESTASMSFEAGDAGRFSGGGNLVFKPNVSSVIKSRIVAQASDGSYTGVIQEAGTIFLDTPFIGTADDSYSNALQIGNLSGTGTISGSNGSNPAGIPYRYLQVNQSTDDSLVYGGTFADSGQTTNRSVGLIKAGKGALILTGNNASPADLCVNGGAVQLGDGGTTGSWNGAIKVGTNGSIVWNRSDAVTVSTSVSVEGSLSQAGSGLLTIDALSGRKGMLKVANGASMKVSNMSDFTGNLTLGENSKLTMGGAYTLGAAGSISSFAGSVLELLNGASLTLAGTDIYGIRLDLVGSATLDVKGMVGFTDGFNVTNGTLTKQGEGELLLMPDTTASIKDILVSAGSVRFAAAPTVTGTITNNGIIYVDNGLTLRANDTGTGTYVLSHGNLDLGNVQISGKIEIAGGWMSNTSGLGARSVSITGLGSGNLDMGGMDGSKLGSINMNGQSGSISNLTGNADLSGTTTNLFLAASNMGTSGTGVILFQNPSQSTLTVGKMVLTLASSAAGNISDQPASYQFVITNGSLIGNKSDVTIGEYNGDMNWTVESVGPDGTVSVKFIQANVIEIVPGADETYTVEEFRKAPSVINNGTMGVDFSDVPEGSPLEATIRYISGTNGNAVFNTGDNAASSVIFSNTSSNETAGNTAYAGSVSGLAQIVKTGDAKLTIDGSVSGQSMSIKEGTLVLNGTVTLAGNLVHEQGSLTMTGATNIGGNVLVQQGTATWNGPLQIAGNMNIQNGASSLNGASTINGSLSLQGGTLHLGANTQVKGMVSVGGGQTLDVASGVILSVGDISGRGSIRLDNSSLTISKENVSDLNLDLDLSGTGHLFLANCNLSLTNDGSIASGISLSMKSGSLNTNGQTVTLSAFDELSGLNLGADGTVILAAEDGSNLISGTIEGSGFIVVTGAGDQVIHSAGNESVDIIQRASGGNLVIEALDPASGLQYRSMEIGSLGRVAGDTSTVSLMNDASLETLSVHQNGRLLLGGATHDRPVTVNLSGSETAASFQSGAVLGLTVDRTGVDAGMASNQWAYLAAESGRMELSGTAPGLQVNLYGLGEYASWGALRAFDVNILYAGKGLIVDGSTSTTWTADMIQLNYAGFANIVFDIHALVTDGALLQAHLISHASSPFLKYASTEHQKTSANVLWVAAGEINNLSTDMQDFTNAMGDALRAGSKADIQEGLSSFAGSGITSLLSAQMGGMKSQTREIRNRVSQMGLAPGYLYDDLPVFNAWISGTGRYQKLANQDDASGYSLNTWGGTAGFDLNFSETLTIGAAFSAHYGDLSAYQSQGNLDSFYGNVFVKVQNSRWGHQVILSFGRDDASLDRTVDGPEARVYTSTGQTNGSSYGAFYEGTYDIYMDEAETALFQPIINASIYKSSMDAFTERGGLNMHVNGMDATYGDIGLGARMLGILGSDITGRESTGEFRTMVSQTIVDTRATADVTPVGAPVPGFRTHGAKAGSTALQVGAGLTFPVMEQGTVFIDVDAEFRSRMNSVSGTVGYRIAF